MSEKTCVHLTTADKIEIMKLSVKHVKHSINSPEDGTIKDCYHAMVELITEK